MSLPITGDRQSDLALLGLGLAGLGLTVAAQGRTKNQKSNNIWLSRGALLKTL